jgi:DNA-binding NarL/FixJ family response regulator
LSSGRASTCDSAFVRIRVVLAEDNTLVREGVRRLLEREPDIEIAASCVDLPELLAAIESERPDVVLTDIRMPPTNQDEGIQVADRLRKSKPEVGVVVLSQFAAPEYALALLEKGADRRGYLLKDRVGDADQLAGAIREVASGGSVIDPKVVETLVAARSRGESPLAELTPRERETLEEMAQGKNNAAIAASLVITERSVEKVVHSIFQKLGLRWQPDINRRVKAVLLYLAERED